MNDAKLWTIFSLYIRLRDANDQGICYCITCGQPVKYNACHAGHGIGRQHKSVKYNECNVHAQCVSCNAFNAGEQAKYKEEINKRYGADTWNKLEIAAKQKVKFGKFEIDQMAEFYKGEIKKLKKLKHL